MTHDGRTLFLDLAAGIAGDMLLAALLDVGADERYVRDGLQALGLEEPWEMQVQPTRRLGIAAVAVTFVVDGRRTDATFDEVPHEHCTPTPGTPTPGTPTPGHAPARPYAVVRQILDASPMPPRVRERAHAVFASLAAAEAAVHGTTVDDVHFHEVGSTDAILDVVGCCLALESLHVAHLHATPLHLGRGFVHTAHGRLPIPAPATLRLLEGFEAYQTDVRGELVTPTGAALVRGLGCTVGALPPFVLQRIGHGAGRKDREIPNVVRAMLVTPTSTGTSGAHRDAVDATPHQVVQISCNLDDVDPRTLGTLVEELLHGGALDAWIVPVVMKKGRPGFVVETLARPADADRLAQTLLSRTTTMGVRMHPLDRRILHRSWIPVDVDGHTVRVKVGKDHGDVVQVTPEFDDVHAVASKTGRAHRWIVHEATARALEVLGAPSARSTPADDGSPAP